MRHITDGGLDSIDELLARVRDIDGLTEKKRGVFYRKAKAFLHFHEDGNDVYADCRLDGAEFDRMRVTTGAEQRKLVAAIRKAVQ